MFCPNALYPTSQSHKIVQHPQIPSFGNNLILQEDRKNRGCLPTSGLHPCATPAQGTGVKTLLFRGSSWDTGIRGVQPTIFGKEPNLSFQKYSVENSSSAGDVFSLDEVLDRGASIKGLCFPESNSILLIITLPFVQTTRQCGGVCVHS